MWSPEGRPTRALRRWSPALVLLLAACAGPRPAPEVIPGSLPSWPMRATDPTAGLSPPPLPAVGDFWLRRVRMAELRRLDDAVRRHLGPGRPALVLVTGSTTLRRLARDPRAHGLLHCGRRVCRLRAPLHVARGATLRLEDLVLRLEATEGALLSVAGRLAAVRVEVRGERRGVPDRFVAPERFRPFLAVHTGGRAELEDCRLAHLGYAAPRAYGLVFAADRPRGPPPTGRVVRCTIEDLYYGLYARAATGLVLRENRLRASVRYGLDLYGGTRRVVMVDNRVSGTRERHGIVLSTDVRQVLVARNVSRHNAGAGLVVHRRSHGVAVIGNRLEDNRRSGLAVYDSARVLVRGNRIARNGDYGLRVRDSEAVAVIANRFAANRPAALRLYTVRGRTGVLLQGNRFVSPARGELAGTGIAWIALTANRPPLSWTGPAAWVRALARLGDRPGLVRDPRRIGRTISWHTME